MTMQLTHIFFDVGGVLGTNGWDHVSRADAVQTFDLDAEVYDELHREAVGSFEQGEMTLDEYLDATVFHRPRDFSRRDFWRFMMGRSRPHEETIALARRLARSGDYRLMTLNNESAELNEHRIRAFGLRPVFEAFFSSCFLGVTKPARRIYEMALAVAQAEPAATLFIDDRDQNLVPARRLGMRTIHYTGPEALADALLEEGVRWSGARER